jgi:hypothetical protein
MQSIKPDRAANRRSVIYFCRYITPLAARVTARHLPPVKRVQVVFSHFPSRRCSDAPTPGRANTNDHSRRLLCRRFKKEKYI